MFDAYVTPDTYGASVVAILRGTAGRGMSGKIFINYRRDDERAVAARIRDRLAGVFGSSNVFMDVDNLMAGQRLTDVGDQLAVLGLPL